MSAGRIFVLDGPSGTGKSTLVARLLADPALGLTFCPRVTTRAPRPGDGSDYSYVSQEEFDAMEARGDFASFRRFEFGMCYGLPRSRVEAVSGRALCLTDLGTVDQVKACWPSALVIMVVSPLEEIEERLRARGSNTEEQIAERLGNARRALEKVPMYDYVVPNRQGSLDRTVARLAFLIGGSP